MSSTFRGQSVPSQSYEVKLRHGQKPSRRWSPISRSVARLMDKAHESAVARQNAIEMSRAVSGLSKPSRAVTNSQKIRKRSAEVCRMKFSIYADLLERENRVVWQQCNKLKLLRNAYIADCNRLKHRIDCLKQVRNDMDNRAESQSSSSTNGTSISSTHSYTATNNQDDDINSQIQNASTHCLERITLKVFDDLSTESLPFEAGGDSI